MSYKILLTIMSIAIIYFSNQFFLRLLTRIAKRKQATEKRTFYIKRIFNLIFLMCFLVSLAIIWGVNIKGLSIFVSSISAVIGVAMFAQWSILSNITASLIIFFAFPAKVGDKIKIIDKDHSVEGTIKEIGLFHIILKDDKGDPVMYPNNLFLQKPIVKLS